MACALPAGSRRARDQVDALAALAAHPALSELRSDRAARYVALWRALVCAADWRTMTYCGTWDALADTVGVSRSTVARAVRWYRGAGLLGIVHTGASAGALGGDTNRAPTYVIAVPDVSAGHSPTEVIDTPPVGDLSGVKSIQDAHARGAAESAPLRGLDPSPMTGGRWSMSAAPRTRRERLAAAELLIWQAPTLRGLSPRLLRHLLRRQWDAGWSPGDVLYALDHMPTGQAWTYTTSPHTPAAWIRHRLGQWVSGGELLPSRSQRARAQTVAADQVARRVERAAEWRAELAARVVPGDQVAQRARAGGARVREALARALGHACGRADT